MNKINLQILMIANALMYLLATPIELSDSLFIVFQSIITLVNLLTMYQLLKRKEWTMVFLYFVVALLFKPFYFSGLLEESLPFIHITIGVLVFLISFTKEKEGRFQ